MAKEWKVGSKSSDDEMGEALESLIPGLPDDIACLCLIRVPNYENRVLGNVCKSWKRLVEDKDFLSRQECKVKLMSSDGDIFEVCEAVVFESQTIKNIIEDTAMYNPVPLPNVSTAILVKVIQYCKYHVDAAKLNDGRSAIGEDDVKLWDEEFVKVDQATLFDLILAANFLNIKSLLDLTCQTVADVIRQRTPQEIRRTFNINNVLTVEEEEEVRRENQWAFE